MIDLCDFWTEAQSTFIVRDGLSEFIIITQTFSIQI